MIQERSAGPVLLPGNEVYVDSVHEKMNEAGELTDKATIEFLDIVVFNFIEFYKTQSVSANVKNRHSLLKSVCFYILSVSVATGLIITFNFFNMVDMKSAPFVHNCQNRL